jgi:hypothetical protein
MSVNNDDVEDKYEYQEPPPSLFSIPQFISVESTNDKLRQTIIDLKQILKNLKIFKASDNDKIIIPTEQFSKHMIVLQKTVDELKNTIEET